MTDSQGHDDQPTSEPKQSHGACGHGHGHHHGHSHSGERVPWNVLVGRGVFALVVTTLLVGYGSSFSVREGRSSIVTRFGNPIRTINEPGFHGKLPWPIEQVHEIDRRGRHYEPPTSGVFTRDKKNVMLWSYVVWRVEDPLLFFQSVGTIEAAQQKIGGMVADAKILKIGDYDLSALVSTNEREIRGAELEQSIQNHIHEDALAKYGVAIEQVGLKRIAYPEENIGSVLDSMRTDRSVIADGLRAQGKQKSQAKKNETTQEVERILSEAKTQAGTFRGEGAEEAARIRAVAYEADPEFFRFWQSNQMLRQLFHSKVKIILPSDFSPLDAMTGWEFAAPEEKEPSP